MSFLLMFCGNMVCFLLGCLYSDWRRKKISILIKGMEMPKDGYHHTICIYADGTVSTGGREYTAVPVPSHGRLIDADALIADIKRQCREVFRVNAVSPDDFWITRNEAYNERLWETWCEAFFGYLRTRPTIIPASKEAWENDL